MSMGAIKLTSAQRRQMQKLGAHVDEATNGDRIYFERHPERRHRIRLSHLCEIAQNEILAGRSWALPDGMGWFTVVKNIVPGARSRLWTAWHDDAQTDEVDEDSAREVYEILETPNAWTFEQAVLRAKARRQS
jgi:hypothetical protein